jgi:hypothetical protein
MRPKGKKWIMIWKPLNKGGLSLKAKLVTSVYRQRNRVKNIIHLKAA